MNIHLYVYACVWVYMHVCVSMCDNIKNLFRKGIDSNSG